mmetsp:Transcript_23963/g.44470  ORF Transcript_23963/g.44470 Transcript_23963/m.44470 type:complete len:153 (+) Transcript_23963:156-614(+)
MALKAERRFLRGKCYCGGIELQIEVVDPADEPKEDPTLPAFCHCASCKRAHAAPVSWCIYAFKDYVKILRGQDLIKNYLGKGVVRSFCSTCGSRIFNRGEHDKYQLGFFPALLDAEYQLNLPPHFKAHFAEFPEERTLDLDLLTRLSNTQET